MTDVYDVCVEEVETNLTLKGVTGSGDRAGFPQLLGTTFSKNLLPCKNESKASSTLDVSLGVNLLSPTPSVLLFCASVYLVLRLALQPHTCCRSEDSRVPSGAGVWAV